MSYGNVIMSSGWDTLPFLSHPDEIANFDFPQHAVALQRFRKKHLIWVEIDDYFSRVTLKFDGWPSKTIGHLLYAPSSFVQHFVAIGALKLELQDDFEKQ